MREPSDLIELHRHDYAPVEAPRPWRVSWGAVIVWAIYTAGAAGAAYQADSPGEAAFMAVVASLIEPARRLVVSAGRALARQVPALEAEELRSRLSARGSARKAAVPSRRP